MACRDGKWNAGPGMSHSGIIIRNQMVAVMMAIIDFSYIGNLSNAYYLIENNMLYSAIFFTFCIAFPILLAFIDIENINHE